MSSVFWKTRTVFFNIAVLTSFDSNLLETKLSTIVHDPGIILSRQQILTSQAQFEWKSDYLTLIIAQRT